MVTTKEVQALSSSSLNVDVQSTPSLHETPVNSKGYIPTPPGTHLLAYIPEEAEEIEIYDGPWEPDVRRKLGLDQLPAFFTLNKES